MNKNDTTTYFPFELIDNRESEWSDTRISFNNWDWFKETHKCDSIDDYYINGYGIQGLVLAARLASGLPAYSDSMDPNSEGNTCFLIFEDHAEALETAKLASAMITDKDKMRELVIIANDNGFSE